MWRTFGAVHVPLGVAGPIRVNGEHARGLYYVPFATTEGTLGPHLSIWDAGDHRGRGGECPGAGGLPDITPCFMLASGAMPARSRSGFTITCLS